MVVLGFAAGMRTGIRCMQLRLPKIAHRKTAASPIKPVLKRHPGFSAFCEVSCLCGGGNALMGTAPFQLWC